MEIKTKVGDLDLIESGSIVLNKDSKLYFSIEDLVFEFVFPSADGEEKTPNTKLVTTSSKSVQFQLINYDNPLGTGSPNPLNVASLSTGVDLYLQYAVHGKNKMKIFHYTWYSKPTSKVNAVSGESVEPNNKEK